MRLRIQAESPLPDRRYLYPALDQDQDTIRVLCRRIALELLRVRPDEIVLFFENFEVPDHVLVSSVLRDNDLVIVRKRPSNRSTDHREVSTSSSDTTSTHSSESDRSSSTSSDERESDDEDHDSSADAKKHVRFSLRRNDWASNDISSSEEQDELEHSYGSTDTLNHESEEEMDTSPCSQVNINFNKQKNIKTKLQKTPALPKPLIKPRQPQTPGKLRPISPPPPPGETPIPLIYNAIPVSHASPMVDDSKDDDPPSSGTMTEKLASRSINGEKESQVDGHDENHNFVSNPSLASALPLSLAGPKRKKLTKMLAIPSKHIRFDEDKIEEDIGDQNIDMNQDAKSEASSVCLKPRMLFTRADLYDGMVYDSPNNSRNVGTPIAAPLAAMNPTPIQSGPKTAFSTTSRTTTANAGQTAQSVSNDSSKKYIKNQQNIKRKAATDQEDNDNGGPSRKRSRQKRRSRHKSRKPDSENAIKDDERTSSAYDESIEDLLGEHDEADETKLEIEDIGEYHGEEVVLLSDKTYAEMLQSWSQKRSQKADNDEGTLIRTDDIAADEKFESQVQQIWNTVTNSKYNNLANKVLEKAAGNTVDIFGQPSPIPWMNLPLPKRTPSTVVPASRIKKKSLLNPLRTTTASPTPATDERGGGNTGSVDRHNIGVRNTSYASNKDRRSATPLPAIPRQNSGVSSVSHVSNYEHARSTTPLPSAATTITTVMSAPLVKSYSSYPTMGIPTIGDVLAYKVFTMQNYSPLISEYREAEIIAYDAVKQLLTLRPKILIDEGKEDKDVGNKKFELPPDDDYAVQDFLAEVRDGRDYKIRIADLLDARIVS